jgi:hypothetical protein
MKKLTVIISFLLVFGSIVFATSTQQSNKIFLNPFYRESMTKNLNYTFNSVQASEFSIVKEYYTPQCLSECHLPIRFKLDSTLSVTKANSKTYIDLGVRADPISSITSYPNYEVKMLVNETKQQDDPICTKTFINYPNSSKGYETTCKSNMKNYTITKWIDVKYPIDFEVGKEYVIDFIVHRLAREGNVVIDAVPKIAGITLVQYSWWNSSWASYMPLYRNNTDVQPHVNGIMTVWVNTTGAHAINSCVNELRLVDYVTNVEVAKPNMCIRKESYGPNCLITIRENSSANTPYPNDPFVLIFYNNTQATAPTDNSFCLWYDDFEDGSVQAFWTSKSGTITESGGMLHVANDAPYIYTTVNASWATPNTLYAKVKNVSNWGGVGTGTCHFCGGNYQISAWESPLNFIGTVNGDQTGKTFTYTFVPNEWNSLILQTNFTYIYGKRFSDTNDVNGELSRNWGSSWNPMVDIWNSGGYGIDVDYIEIYSGLVNFYKTTDNGYLGNQVVLDTTPPVITVVSPLNDTYLVGTAELNISVNEETSLCLWNLDGTANSTLTGYFQNLTFEYGTHTVNVYCNDTSNNWGSNTTVVFIYTENVPPTYSNVGYSSDVCGANTSFWILFEDNIALDPNGYWQFATNNSGAWVVEAPNWFTSTPSWSHATITLNSTNNTIIGFLFYAYDNGHNLNTSYGEFVCHSPEGLVNLIKAINQSLSSQIDTIYNQITTQQNSYFNQTSEMMLSINDSIKANNQSFYYEMQNVNQSIYFKLYKIQDEIASLNWTLVNTSLNLTNVTINEIGDEVILKMLQHARILNQRVVNFHNHQYCVDNSTLQHNVTYNYCIGGNCKLLEDIMNEPCQYGCDPERAVCNSAPYLTNIYIFGAVIILITVSLVLLRLLKFKI